MISSKHVMPFTFFSWPDDYFVGSLQALITQSRPRGVVPNKILSWAAPPSPACLKATAFHGVLHGPLIPSRLDPMWRKPFYSFGLSFHLSSLQVKFSFLALPRGEWGPFFFFFFRFCQRQPGGPRQRVEAQRPKISMYLVG